MGQAVFVAKESEGPNRLADQVFERLLEDIVSGRLVPGTPLSELELGATLGVSRTPIREALIKLADVNLVQIFPQRGTFVAPISADAFKHAQFIREHLECALVSEAVRYIDATSLRELNDILARQEAAAALAEPDEFYELDEEFHRAIARLGRRVEVWQVIRQTKIHFDRIRRLTLRADTSQIPGLIEQHREILRGLANCNEIEAVAAMRRHLREVFRHAEDIFLEQSRTTTVEPPKRRRANKTPPASAL
jgi:DNA-binding GntR family transcriptional regulator